MDAGGWVGWGVGLSVAVLDGAGVIVGDGDCPQANADNRTTAAQIDNFVGWAMFHLVEVMNGELAAISIDHLILPGNNLPIQEFQRERPKKAMKKPYAGLANQSAHLELLITIPTAMETRCNR